MSQVIFFGASVTQGVGDAAGGWVDRLKGEIHKKMYAENMGEIFGIFNLGVSGNTAEDLLKRMPTEIEARKRKEEPFVLVISVGTNDSKATGKPENTIQTPAGFKENLQAIIKLARGYTDKILFVGLWPTDDTKTQPKGASYFWQERVRMFDRVMSETALQNNIQKVEIFDDFLKQDWRAMLFADGLHPNSRGHQWIADRVRPKLWKLLNI